MTKEELDAMVAEEAERLGVSSPEFIERHEEIMGKLEEIEKREKERKQMVAARVDKIIAAMTASCMSPKELADAAGVSVNIIYRMRRGYLVKMDRFGRVCKALGISPEDVIDYSRLRAES